MKTLYKTLLLILATAACFVIGMSLRNSSSAQTRNISVATIDIQYILDNYSETVAAGQKLDTLKIRKEDDLRTKIENQFGTTDFSELDKRRRLAAERALEEADREFQSEVAALRAAEWEPAVDKIFEAIKKIASQQGFDIVLSKEAVLYGGVEITDTVLKQLNEK